MTQILNSFGSPPETLSTLTADPAQLFDNDLGLSVYGKNLTEIGLTNLKYQTMLHRIDNCSKTTVHLVRTCGECGEPVLDKTFLSTCQNRYCSKCFSKRYAITRKRIFDSYRKGFHKRCIHLVFTTERGFYTKAKKKELEYLIYRFFKKLKQLHYSIIGIKGMDLTLNKEGVFLHCHTALRITFQLTDINKHILHQTWCEVTNNKSAVLLVKYSSTNATLSYIAKRTSGMIGHQPEPTFLSDYMTTEQYFQTFYRSRYITPIGICSNIAPNFKQTICEKCGNSEYFVMTIIESTEIPEQPPPTIENYVMNEKIGGFV